MCLCVCLCMSVCVPVPYTHTHTHTHTHTPVPYSPGNRPSRKCTRTWISVASSRASLSKMGGPPTYK